MDQIFGWKDITGMGYLEDLGVHEMICLILGK
jgi:hypothetical protein